ncbi:hypothetical protein [Mediterraneibacter agrestimuris]|uniref:hypothetical protein n=1 Tax=Mediterraneibacter agrestimuris TaxID=2941333 RepID=UPI002041968E|nr:hypothetical protein [Mediterraneibacter agrestimuris]
MEKQYFEPNRNNKNNYMLDTSAYNYIARKPELLDVLKQSTAYGFCYYSTAIQDRELAGKGAKTYNRECEPVRKKTMSPELIKKFDSIDRELNIILFPEVAVVMKNHTRVDGTNRFISEKSLSRIVFEEIIKNNDKESDMPYEYNYDAIIAEASVYYECTLVSNDRKQRNAVNLHVSNGAITVDELLKVISEVKEQGEADTP